MAEKRSEVMERAADREIVLTRLFDAPRTMVWEAWTDPAQIEKIAIFEEEAGGTRVTMRAVFASPEARDRNVREYGSIEGGKQTLERLAEHLSLQLLRQTHGGVR
jgi:uncharacterized protein YndB with AHSA1/START domain